MKLSRIIVVLVVIVVIAIVVVYLYESTTATPVNKAWAPGPSYPLSLNGVVGVAGQQCINSTGYAYCIGGQDVNTGPRDEVYSTSALPSGNLSGWTAASNPYPVNTDGESCVAYSGFAYCVGGSYNENGDDVASSYFASLNGAQVGEWTSTTPYPIAIDSQSCVTSTGYIYCIGGNNETDGTNADSTLSSSVWYAQLSASGIGQWNHSTAYPSDVLLPSCFSASGYVFCLGGADQNNNAVGTAYFAQLTSAGVGSWTKTTSYPQQESGLACVVSSGTIYCLGGQGGQNSYTSAAYYAPISTEGIGAWTRAGNYPNSLETICFALSGDIYCVGGFDSGSAGENGAVYYAPLNSF